MSEPSVSRRRRRRLSRSGDFDNAVRRGASAANRHMVVYAFERAAVDADPAPRLGLAVSRKVGNAVQRNTIKRVLREQFSEIADTLRPGVDIVVIARPGLSEYLSDRGSAAVRDRLAELAHQVASPDSDTGSEQRPRLEG